MKASVVVASAFLSSSLFAGRTMVYPLYVIDVPAGVTNEFSSADSLSVVTESGGVETTNSITYAEFNAVTSGTLIKTGAGVLKPQVTIPNFNGQIHVDEGVLYITQNNQRGKCIACAAGVYPTDDNAVFVAAGATLVADSSALAQSVTTENKKQVIEGSGAPGEGGAIVARRKTNGGNNEGWHIGPNLTLSGDATIVNEIKGGRLTFVNGYTPSPILDLAGHTLTIVGLDTLKAPDFNHNQRPMTAGNLIFKNSTYHMQGAAPSDASDANFVEMRDGSVLQFEYFASKAATRGTLKVTDRTVIRPSSTSSRWWGYGDLATNAHNWVGPVQLDNRLAWRNENTGDSGFGLVFPNVVSGAGGFEPISATSAQVTGFDINLHLMNPANTFTGAVVLDRDVLTLHADGALPANGAGIVATNSQLRLPGVGSYALPGAYFYGTGTVSRGSGRWTKAFVKDGDGSFDYFSAVGGPRLEVRGGSVRLPTRLAGLYEGYQDFSETGQAMINKTCNLRTTFTNSVLLATEQCYNHNISSSGIVYWVPSRMNVYSGYIWNNNSTSENWTFASTIGGHSLVQLYLDGVKVIDTWRGDAGDHVRDGRRTDPIAITPGPHAFELRLGTRSSSGDQYCGPYYTNNTEVGMWNWNWKDKVPANSTWAFGLGLDRRGGTSLNMNDYQELRDPGDGSLFTLSGNETEMAALCRPAFDTCAFAAGTSLDLNGQDYVMANLEGFPVVTNGDLCVTGVWAVASARLAAGETMTVWGDLDFGATAQLMIDDIGALPHQAGAESKAYVLATADSVTVSPEFLTAWAADPAHEHWQLSVSDDGRRLELVHQSGMMILFR